MLFYCWTLKNVAGEIERVMGGGRNSSLWNFFSMIRAELLHKVYVGSFNFWLANSSRAPPLAPPTSRVPDALYPSKRSTRMMRAVKCEGDLSQPRGQAKIHVRGMHELSVNSKQYFAMDIFPPLLYYVVQSISGKPHEGRNATVRTTQASKQREQLHNINTYCDSDRWALSSIVQIVQIKGGKRRIEKEKDGKRERWG